MSLRFLMHGIPESKEEQPLPKLCSGIIILPDACRLPITAHWTIFLLLMIMPFKRTEHICILPVSLLYAFGYGLSYTKFDYRKLSVDQDAENVRLSFTIKNSGKYNGDEVAQVYVQFPEIGVKVPIKKQLKGFERVHIAKKGKLFRLLLP